MANKHINLNMNKEQERAELHRTIWKIANDLRGSIDGWDFKQYVLGMLFYRFISENLTKYINDGEHRAGEKVFDYTKLSEIKMLNLVELIQLKKKDFIFYRVNFL